MNMQNNNVVSRINNARIYGLPIQFMVVVVLGLAMTIFFGAWAADARVEARNQPFAQAGSGAAQFYFNTHSNGDLAGSLASAGEGEEQGWERAFLFACPLH